MANANFVSKVVRIALKLPEAQKQKKQTLTDALHRSENSGFERNFDAKAHLKNLNDSLA